MQHIGKEVQFPNPSYLDEEVGDEDVVPSSTATAAQSRESVYGTESIS